ncbi:MAG: hypothetical protein COB85_09110 [Bacteroidetes bacterium]|nr:MAG: hypothetical protein COB85_09110 [Bacteroidota bacterium]
MFDSLEQVNILVGNMDKSSISDSSWYLENYSIDYPSTEKVKMIEKYSNSASVEVYFGSWCSDSYTWVPAFLKIAENTSLGKELSIIGLPKDLAKREAYATGKNILKVPTFVFMRNGVEIGRIIESPIENLSDDIIKILVSR